MKKFLLLALVLCASVSYSQNKLIAYSMSVLPGGGLWYVDEPVSSITYTATELACVYWAAKSENKTQPIVFFSVLKVGELLRLTDVLNKNNMELLPSSNGITLAYKF